MTVISKESADKAGGGAGDKPAVEMVELTIDGIDVSVGPLTTFASIVFISVLIPEGFGDAYLAIPIVLALGAAVGAANGFLVAVVRLPAVVATLGTFFVLGGLSLKTAPTPESAPYGMAKAGVNSLVRSLSREVSELRINVNAVAPGLIETPMTEGVLNDPAKREKSMGNIPWHRPGRPEEIAGLAVFLCTDDADYVTGQTWVMDGGLTMNWGGA